MLMSAQRGKALDFYHIYTPEPFRNRGVSTRILTAAFDYAIKHRYRVTASCPFIAGDFLRRFPSYKALVEPGVFPLAKRGRSGI